MAGCYYNGNGSKYDGHLQYLDLGSLSQISYVHSFEVYDENGYRSTLNDCLFPLAYLYNLKTVVLPNLYKDYNFSLMCCRNLTTAKMPDNLEKIGNNTFSDCGLEEAVISSDQITEIPNEAFADCNALHTIKLPANLERIGERAFIGTWRLGTKEGLTIPSKVREIGAEAFYKSLFDAVDIVLPASLTNIYSAFEGSGARVIHCYMPEPLPLNGFSFGGGSLSNCKLYVPKGCANKYRNAEVWRDFDIEEMEVTGIGSATNDSTATEVARYDANGNPHLIEYTDNVTK